MQNVDRTHELKKLITRLYDQTPLIGWKRRRDAAVALAKDESPEAIDMLADALIRSHDKQVRRIALKGLLELAAENRIEAQEALCHLVIGHDHPLAHEVVLAAQYTPRDPYQRTLLYVLTAQWGKYEQLDADGRLLSTAYQDAEDTVQKRVVSSIQQEGQEELLFLLVKKGQRSNRISEEDGKMILSLLSKEWESEKTRWLAQMVETLVEDGSPEFARVLAEAVVNSTDEHVRDSVIKTLQQLSDQRCINEVCSVWARTRHSALADLLVEHGWVASNPPDLSLLTALKVGQIKAVMEGGAGAIELIIRACRDREPDIAWQARKCLVNLKQIDFSMRVDVVEPLIQACQDVDDEVAHSDEVAQKAREILGQLQDADAIDMLCQRWAATRDKVLTQILLQAKYVARKPTKVRVLSALLSGNPDVIMDGREITVELLVKACEDPDTTIAKWAKFALTHLRSNKAKRFLYNLILKHDYPVASEIVKDSGGVEFVYFLLESHENNDHYIAARARTLLMQLKTPETREALCRLVIEQDHPLVREVVLAAQYAPRDPYQRALLYVLTAQWGEYEELDFDHRLLRTAYQAANESLQRRIILSIQREGQVDLLISLVAEEQRLDKMTENDWELILTSLSRKKEWEKIWWLAQAAPSTWSVQLLLKLKDVKWKPGNDVERKVFTQLLRLAEECVKEGTSNLTDPVTCYATLEGHTSSVIHVVISPNGQILASRDYYGKMRLWSLPDGVMLHTPKGLIEQVDYLVISPDSKVLASVGEHNDYTVKLWNLPYGAALKTLKGHRYYVRCLAISSDGQMLVSGASDNTLRLWSLPDGTPLYKLKGAGSVTSLAISPDSKLVASAGWDTVRLWSLPEGTALHTLKGHLWSIDHLAISPDGQILVSGSGDNTVRLWSLPDGRALHTLKGHTSRISCIAISPDGEVLASGGDYGDPFIRLWSLPDGRALQTLRHPASVTSLTISPDGRVLASGGRDGIVRLWGLPDGTALQTLEGHTASIIRLAISPDGRVLVSGSADSTVRLWALDQRWLEFILALMRWQRRFDIELEDVSRTIQIVEEFDVEIESGSR